MNDISINNLSLSELKELLKELKLYSNLRKQLGRKRGEELFSKLKTGKKTFEVDYFPAMTEELAWQEAEKVFKRAFGIEVKKEDVKFVPKEKLLGGIKVYVDDKTIDLSYEKVEKHLRK